MDGQPNEDTAEREAATAPPSSGSRLDVSGTQVCASTLASVSAAVVASTFGVAGTVVGAAVVSVLATVGSAVYGHGIRQTGAKLQQTPAARLTRPFGRWQQRDPDEAAPEPDHPAPGWKEWVSQRRWGLAVGVAIVFVASLATVTLVELVSQQPLASISGSEPSGSTSIGSLFDGGGQETPDDDTTTTTAPSGTPASTESSESTEPSEEPEPSTSTTSDGTASTSPTTEE